MGASKVTPQEIAEKGLILRSTVGSTVHGLHLPGTDDRDEMGITIEPPERVLGLQNFEQYIQRDRPEGVPSEPGDLDLVVYSLRKYVKLAAAGNPTIIILLFAEPLFVNEAGKDLLANRDLFASREAGKRFLGYLKAQRERLLGTRGQMRVTRTELIEKYGYDTKFAMHAVRLGYQGVEYLTTGKLTLPMRVGGDVCMRIRRGEVPLSVVIAMIEELEVQIFELLDGKSPLPRVPDFKRIDALLVRLYREAWDAAEIGPRRGRADAH
jgi:uncharacterized protein